MKSLMDLHSAMSRLSLKLRKDWYSSSTFRAQREWKRRCSVAFQANSGRAVQAESMHVTLCRIIGNDLFPRHRRGQALTNLHTVLQKEQNFGGWRKLFILNRILDPGVLSEAMEAITKAGHDYEVIPFEPEAYRATRYSLDIFGNALYFNSLEFARQNDVFKDRARLWACAEKIRYLMNINGARNTALACGRRTSDWTLVLDGSCMIPDRTFMALHDDMRSTPSAPYLIIPMKRLAADDDPTAVDISPNQNEEPQIAFRSDATECFDESYPYGFRDKTSLLKYLGVPGPWWSWEPLAWKVEPSRRSPQRNLYKYASASVLRLTSGIEHGSLQWRETQKMRYQSRITAIFTALHSADRLCAAVDATALYSISGCSAQCLDKLSLTRST